MLTNASILLLFGWAFCLAIYAYIFQYAYKENVRVISIMVLPLLLGLVWENWRLSRNWYHLQIKILGALLFSLLAFLNFKGEVNYDFERHLEIWPYGFIGIFTIISALYHDERVVIRLGEGITLLQSICLVYFAFEKGWMEPSNALQVVLLILVGLFCLFSIFHSLSYTKLAELNRLILSIFSSIAMLTFAVDHSIQVLQSDVTENEVSISLGLVALEYFLLGIALMYIFQNFLMLQVYFPAKNRFYDRLHRESMKEMNGLHIARFDSSQLNRLDAILIISLSLALFYINYHFAFIHYYSLIWILFVMAPLLPEIRKVFIKQKQEMFDAK
ncbi:hypothetical protein O3Q51_17275 [Cryomorphaceae bacterium 1068]|nr:hypothetical protein [Cryomorphaceae bacterium 1068]